jgi:hypothetical protein
MGPHLFERPSDIEDMFNRYDPISLKWGPSPSSSPEERCSVMDARLGAGAIDPTALSKWN